MYKYSKDGVSVLTVLDKRKQKMNGLFPVKVQVIHNRKQKYYSTGQEVSIRDWEVLPYTKSRHLSEIRRNIENSFSLIRQQVEFLSFQGEFHFDILNARLGRYSDFSVNALFHKKLEELKENGQANTYLSYKGSLNKIEQFAGKHISFHEITINWLNRFEHHLSASGISYSSMGFYFRNLKCILNIARKDGIIKESQYPFGKGKYEVPTGCGRKLALNLKSRKLLPIMMEPQRLKFIVICGFFLIYVMVLIFVIYYICNTPISSMVRSASYVQKQPEIPNTVRLSMQSSRPKCKR